MFQRLILRSQASIENIHQKVKNSAKRFVDIKTELIEPDKIKLSRKNAPPILSGFVPVFVGRVCRRGQETELTGYFRFNLLAIGLFAGFIGSSILSLISIYLQSKSLGALFSDSRALFELQFSGFCLLVAVFAWMGGKPFREHMKVFLLENFNPQDNKST